MKKPKIIVYTDEFLSPSMTFVSRQIESLQSNFDVSVLTRLRRNEKLFAAHSVDVVPRTLLERSYAAFTKRFFGSDWSIVGRARDSIQSAISRTSPSLIHAHFGPSGLAILPIAMQSKVPLVTTFHGFDASSFLDRPAYRRQLQGLFDYSDIVTVSQEMRSKLVELGASPNKTHCHYIGVPFDAFASPERQSISEKIAQKKRIRFLQVSNFVEKKGHEFTVLAFSRLLVTYSECQLTLVGGGPTMEAVRSLVKKLGIEEKVHFLGHKDSNAVASLMRDSDCFLHHSVTGSNGDKEGIPTVLMEAMASGLPVISTYHAGIPELIQHGLDGILVNERDVLGYVAALNLIMSDNGSIGKNAKKKVLRSFEIDSCSAGLGKFFTEIINRKHVE